jgi:glycosyltransferase involved in cell wall biosynthesis
VTPSYPPFIGGIERHVEELAHGLVERGVRVDVITTTPFEHHHPDTWQGVIVHRFRRIGGQALFCAAPDLVRWMRLNARRWSVIHAHSYHTPVALQAALVSRLSGIPLVLTPHYHGTGHSRLRRALHTPYRMPGHWLMHHAQRVICMSRVERELIRRHFGPAVATQVVPNGVDVADILAARPLRPVVEPGRHLVLSAGRLETYKRVDCLVECMAFLPSEYHLVIAGTGPEQTRLAERAAALGVGARVSLVGGVSRAELLALYHRAETFVTLSHHEAFGMVLLEAAVAGCGVIASDIPAHRDTAGYLPEGRVTFVDRDSSPRELARAIAQGKRPMAASGVDSWPIPTWAEAVDGALACYRSVLQGTGCRP